MSRNANLIDRASGAGYYCNLTSQEGIQLTKTALSSGVIKTLKKEASGSSFTFEQLCREAIVRRWLRNNRIPSWRNPSSPPCELTPGDSRYSIMMADGSRFKVCRADDAVISFDSVAAAKCFAVLAVELEENCEAGRISEFIYLSDMAPGIHSFNFTHGSHRTPSMFLTDLNHRKGYFSQLLKFSIRLLILGEPDAPFPHSENIRKAAHTASNRQEVRLEQQ